MYYFFSVDLGLVAFAQLILVFVVALACSSRLGLAFCLANLCLLFGRVFFSSSCSLLLLKLLLSLVLGLTIASQCTAWIVSLRSSLSTHASLHIITLERNGTQRGSTPPPPSLFRGTVPGMLSISLMLVFVSSCFCVFFVLTCAIFLLFLVCVFRLVFFCF